MIHPPRPPSVTPSSCRYCIVIILVFLLLQSSCKHIQSPTLNPTTPPTGLTTISRIGVCELLLMQFRHHCIRLVQSSATPWLPLLRDPTQDQSTARSSSSSYCNPFLELLILRIFIVFLLFVSFGNFHELFSNHRSRPFSAPRRLIPAGGNFCLKYLLFSRAFSSYVFYGGFLCTFSSSIECVGSLCTIRVFACGHGLSI